MLHLGQPQGKDIVRVPSQHQDAFEQVLTLVLVRRACRGAQVGRLLWRRSRAGSANGREATALREDAADLSGRSAPKGKPFAMQLSGYGFSSSAATLRAVHRESAQAVVGPDRVG